MPEPTGRELAAVAAESFGTLNLLTGDGAGIADLDEVRDVIESLRLSVERTPRLLENLSRVISAEYDRGQAPLLDDSFRRQRVYDSIAAARYAAAGLQDALIGLRDGLADSPGS